jgi:hypothetical protein
VFAAALGGGIRAGVLRMPVLRSRVSAFYRWFGLSWTPLMTTPRPSTQRSLCSLVGHPFLNLAEKSCQILREGFDG